MQGRNRGAGLREWTCELMGEGEAAGHRELGSELRDDPGGRPGWEGGSRGRGMWIHTADSRGYAVETNTTL